MSLCIQAMITGKVWSQGYASNTRSGRSIRKRVHHSVLNWINTQKGSTTTKTTHTLKPRYCTLNTRQNRSLTMAATTKWSYGPVLRQDPVHGEKHQATIIMLHGLGDTGQGWQPVGAQLKIEGAKWLFPTAPTRGITLNMGMEMPGWFDLKSMDFTTETASMDNEGIEDSVKHVINIVEKEIEAGIPPGKIILGGFSQGGLIAVHASVQCKHRLGGCIALSTWSGELDVNDGNKNLPIFIGHGEQDPVVPFDAGKAMFRNLKASGLDAAFTPYQGMAHSTSAQEMDDIKDFITKVLSGTKKVEYTIEEIQSMSAGKLKKLLVSNGVDVRDCLEKSDLIDKAKGSILSE